MQRTSRVSRLVVDAFGADDRLRSRGQPVVAATAAISAPHLSSRFRKLLATPRTV
jgi:hypothetical protein